MWPVLEQNTGHPSGSGTDCTGLPDQTHLLGTYGYHLRSWDMKLHSPLETSCRFLWDDLNPEQLGVSSQQLHPKFGGPKSEPERISVYPHVSSSILALEGYSSGSSFLIYGVKKLELLMLQ